MNWKGKSKLMWVVDLIIENQKARLRRQEERREKRQSKLTHLDIDRFLKKREARRVRERK